MFLPRPIFVAIVVLVSLFGFPVSAVRSFPNRVAFHGDKTGIKFDTCMQFLEAPEYQNGLECPILVENGELLVCEPSALHIAMTLDPEYLRGTIAAVHSILKHTSCPENIFFHFIASDLGSVNADGLKQIVRSAFTSLSFKVYVFKENLVTDLISSSIRHALDNPLNYARSYLAELLEPCVERVIYLDSDVIVVDDIQKLWRISLTGTRTIGAPEYCHVNFTKYFSSEFWLDRELSRIFEGKAPCYFNTGVMVIDLVRWKEGEYTRKVEKWMIIQKERRIYELGSLPPFCWSLEEMLRQLITDGISMDLVEIMW